jgi:hypothetical protein
MIYYYRWYAASGCRYYDRDRAKCHETAAWGTCYKLGIVEKKQWGCRNLAGPHGKKMLKGDVAALGEPRDPVNAVMIIIYSLQ